MDNILYFFKRLSKENLLGFRDLEKISFVDSISGPLPIKLSVF